MEDVLPFAEGGGSGSSGGDGPGEPHPTTDTDGGMPPIVTPRTDEVSAVPPPPVPPAGGGPRLRMRKAMAPPRCYPCGPHGPPDDVPRTAEERLRIEAVSLTHLLTHLPKNPFCKVCEETKIKAKQARAKDPDSVEKPKKWG